MEWTKDLRTNVQKHPAKSAPIALLFFWHSIDRHSYAALGTVTSFFSSKMRVRFCMAATAIRKMRKDRRKR